MNRTTKKQPYKTLDDVPRFVWNGIAGLLRRGRSEKAHFWFNRFALKIANLPNYEAFMLVNKIRAVSEQKYQKIP